MFLQRDTDTVYRGYLKDFWDLYGADIIAIQSQIFKEESIRDKTCRIYLLSQYYLAFELAYSIKLELNMGVYTSESYYETKYSISDLRHRLACNNISLARLFTIFGIVFTPDVIAVPINYNPNITCTSIFPCEEVILQEQSTSCNHCTN